MGSSVYLVTGAVCTYGRSLNSHVWSNATKRLLGQIENWPRLITKRLKVTKNCVSELQMNLCSVIQGNIPSCLYDFVLLFTKAKNRNWLPQCPRRAPVLPRSFSKGHHRKLITSPKYPNLGNYSVDPCPHSLSHYVLML